MYFSYNQRILSDLARELLGDCGLPAAGQPLPDLIQCTTEQPVSPSLPTSLGSSHSTRDTKKRSKGKASKSLKEFMKSDLSLLRYESRWVVSCIVTNHSQYIHCIVALLDLTVIMMNLSTEREERYNYDIICINNDTVHFNHLIMYVCVRILLHCSMTERGYMDALLYRPLLYPS